MPIVSPKLPPKDGYVESNDQNGNPIYLALPETSDKQRIIDLIYDNTNLRVQVRVLSNQIEFTEDLIAELAMQVYQV